MIIIFLAIPFFSGAQPLEFHSVTRLPSSVNSAGEESLPMMSPEGDLLFVRALYAGNVGGKFSGIDVWHAPYRAGMWDNAKNSLPGGINNDGHNAVVGISGDGKKRYLMNARPNERMSGIYVTTRINNYWTRPELVILPGIQNQDFVGVHVAPDADVIFISMRAPDSRGEEDLYFTVKDETGQWTMPRNLGPTINTTGYEISPFLSADKRRLYFASNGHGGEGDADIFYSERLYNSWETWSVPVNLGKAVNSNKFDAYFSIYGDSIAFFASNRDGRYADLYAVKVTPARSVLAPGQRYLSASEWNREVGGSVSNEIVFPVETTALNQAQQELLFYIANKLQLQRSILFHLIVREEESTELREERLAAVRDHLIQSGIAEERIIVEQSEMPEKGQGGKIEIRLIE